MIVRGKAVQRGARFTLTARSNRKHVFRGQIPEVGWFHEGQVFLPQVRRAGSVKVVVQRTAQQPRVPSGVFRYLRQGTQPRDVAAEAAHNHASLCICHEVPQAGVQRAFTWRATREKPLSTIGKQGISCMLQFP